MLDLSTAQAVRRGVNEAIWAGAPTLAAPVLKGKAAAGAAPPSALSPGAGGC